MSDIPTVHALKWHMDDEMAFSEECTVVDSSQIVHTHHLCT